MSAAAFAAQGARRRIATVLALVILSLPYVYRIPDVPLIKVDEFCGAQASWEIWQHGRFALPAFAGHLAMAERTFFHPPGSYLVNALWVGPLRPSAFSIRLGPGVFALLSFVALYAVLRRALAGAPRAMWLALLGVAIAAWNPLTFVLARHARPETLVVLLGVCAVWLLRPRVLPALGSGLLCGFAFFSHVFAAVLPATLGLVLVWQRAWRALAAYALGFSVFAALLALWLAAGWPDFQAELHWMRGEQLDATFGGYLAKRVAGAAALLRDPRITSIWGLEALLLALLWLPPAPPLRLRALTLLVTLHAVLFLLPRPSPYYAIAILYFCAGAIPLALAQRARADGVFAPRWLLAAIAAALLVQSAGLGFVIWRDRDARYDAVFAPLRAAVERADPQRHGATLGSEVQYLAFWDRPFLVRNNPSLWTSEHGAITTPESLLEHWKQRGVRFVLLSSLHPEQARFGPLDPQSDAALIATLRSQGRVLERVPTRFYSDDELPYREAVLEVIDLGAPR